MLSATQSVNRVVRRVRNRLYISKLSVIGRQITRSDVYNYRTLFYRRFDLYARHLVFIMYLTFIFKLEGGHLILKFGVF